jgi:hypothetical protein
MREVEVSTILLGDGVVRHRWVGGAEHQWRSRSGVPGGGGVDGGASRHFSASRDRIES